MKESTRSGRLSPHSAPIEVGPHPRRLPRCPLESSNGAPHRMRSQRRSLSFIGEAPAAQLRRRMTTDPYVTTHFFQALTLNSPWCSLLHDGGGMTETDASTPPAVPAALGDGCARTDSSGRGSAGPPLARIAQLRHGCCPPPASLTPLACGCCKPPLNRASQQLPLLSCSRRRTQPSSSASSAPHRAVTQLFAGRLKGPVASSAAHAHERAEHRSNASGWLACFIPRARTALRRLCCP